MFWGADSKSNINLLKNGLFLTFRGEAKALIGSVIVAAASGVSVSFAILSNSLAAMIGNAISLSLLPPAVNCVSSLSCSFHVVRINRKLSFVGI